MNDQKQYAINLPDDVSTDLIAFDPAWIDSSGFPYGAIEWAKENLKSRQSKIFGCYLMGQLSIAELHRFDDSKTLVIAWGTKARVRMAENHYTVYTQTLGRDEERRYERRVDPSGTAVWVPVKEAKYVTLPTALNCPPTIWLYQREVSRQLCLRWNDNTYDELLVAVDDLLGRYVLLDGPTTPEMAHVFYHFVNILELNHPLDDKVKRWLHPVQFFSILHRVAEALKVDEKTLTEIVSATSAASKRWPATGKDLQ